MEPREYDIVLIPEAEGGYSVLVPELPSVATQGRPSRRRSTWRATRSRATSK